MRCLRLAEALRDIGHDPVFISRELPGNVNRLIHEKNFNLLALKFDPSKTAVDKQGYESWLGVGIDQEIAELRVILSNSRKYFALIVDHYALDKKWEKALGPFFDRLIVIDDLANRNHDCDILIDQNYYLNGQTRYSGLLPGRCQQLSGPRYAIIDKAYQEISKRVEPRIKVEHVFAYFGGVDATCEHEKLIAAIVGSPLLKDVKFHFSLGIANPRKAAILNAASELANVTTYEFIENLPEFLCKMDLSIGGGGSTLWEKACVGLPSVVISVADNQVETCKALAQERYIDYLGPSELVDTQLIRAALEEYVTDTDKLLKASVNIRNITDGCGITRIIRDAQLQQEYYGKN
jgi:UDP-2,4-diacetamido-2,4,6-trideoxy-beta-L-altropyranose hydrolase